MRRLRVLIVVLVLGFGWTSPVAAQVEVEMPAWGWEALAERLAGWAEGAWDVIAGAGAGAGTMASPPEDDGGTQLLTVGGGEQATTETSPGQGDTYPGLDPDG